MALKLGWPCWVGVVAEDLDAQRRFYRDVLGMAELAAGHGWVHSTQPARLIPVQHRPGRAPSDR